MHITKWTVLLALLVPVISHATVIRQRPYRYTFETAVATEGEHFVVCSNCPDNQLSLLPVAPKLAVRMTSEGLPTMPVVTHAPETPLRNEETSRNPGRTETVRFAFDSAQLSRQEQERLSALLKEFPATSTYDLTGYTCTIGSDAYNERLAHKRAAQVAAFLTSGGVTVGAVTGKGRCCPVSSDKRLNRRVEIQEQRKGEQ